MTKYDQPVSIDTPAFESEPVRDQKEEASRAEHISRLTKRVEELFDGDHHKELRKAIIRSFDVPQFGEYHNEGMLMDTHLHAMRESIDLARKGELRIEGLPDEAREMLQRTAQDHQQEMEQYVFLHDISKPDVLRIEHNKNEGEQKGKAWEGTLEQLYTEYQIPENVRRSPAALRAFLADRGVKGISYYNQGIEIKGASRKTNKAMHSDAGADHIEGFTDVDVPPLLLAAIRKHEVAYQFTFISAENFEKHFSSIEPDYRDMVIAASLIDTLASIRKNGRPDLTNFIALFQSKQNADRIQRVEHALLDHPTLDTEKVTEFLKGLRKNSNVLAPQAELLTRALIECKPTTYDFNALRSNVDELIRTGELTDAEALSIIELVRDGRVKDIGRLFGKKMKVLKPVLSASEQK